MASKSQAKKTSKSIVKSTKNCNPHLLCDPSPAVLRYAQKKAIQRSTILTEPTYAPWVKTWEQLQYKIINATHNVETRQPMVWKENCCSLQKYNAQGKTYQKIEANNTRLLDRIAQIYIDDSPNVGPKYAVIQPLVCKNRGEIAADILSEENAKKKAFLKTVQPMYSRKKQLAWYAEQEKHMALRSIFPLHFKPQACPKFYRSIIDKSNKSPKQYAYLQMEQEDTLALNLVCELFAGLCPFTTTNFQRLANNKKLDCDCRTYRCKFLDKLISVPRPDGTYERVYWQVGHLVEAFPQLASYIAKETTNVKHSKAGYLTKPNGLATGEFYVTLGPAPYLDDLCSIFGRVVGNGMLFLEKMQQNNVDTQGNLITPVHITDCGVVKAPKDVPASMLMRDFIAQIKEDVIPFIHKYAYDEGEPPLLPE